MTGWTLEQWWCPLVAALILPYSSSSVYSLTVSPATNGNALLQWGTIPKPQGNLTFDVLTWPWLTLSYPSVLSKPIPKPCWHRPGTTHVLGAAFVVSSAHIAMPMSCRCCSVTNMVGRKGKEDSPTPSGHSDHLGTSLSEPQPCWPWPFFSLNGAYSPGPTVRLWFSGLSSSALLPCVGFKTQSAPLALCCMVSKPPP